MDKKPNYRIKIEIIGEENEDSKVDESLLEGIECNGFLLLLDHGELFSKFYQNISIVDIAEMMKNDNRLISAAMISGIL